MNTAIVYSSITGNTKRIAESLKLSLSGSVIFHVDDAPVPENFDLIILGYWVDRGTSDKKMTEYMKRLNQCTLILFGTMGADPEGEYAKGVKTAVERNLSGCRLMSHIQCRGEMQRSTLDRFVKVLEKNPEDELAVRKVNSYHASYGHPDDEDIKTIVDSAKKIVYELN